jgi:hypothetical protein
MDEKEITFYFGQMALAQFQLRQELELQKSLNAALKKQMEEQGALIEKLRNTNVEIP